MLLCPCVSALKQYIVTLIIDAHYVSCSFKIRYFHLRSQKHYLFGKELSFGLLGVSLVNVYKFVYVSFPVVFEGGTLDLIV